MRVHELIEKLQALDGNAEVMIPAHDSDRAADEYYIDVLEIVPIKLAKSGYEQFSPDGEAGPKFDAVVISFNPPEPAKEKS